jgi:hypothetical protein
MSHHTYIVGTTVDAIGFGTLRSAILYADAHPGTTIEFAHSLAHQTITLASDLPLLDSNVTIDCAHRVIATSYSD